ncbi:TonB-dependent receptor [Anditalea andensis]|uniref:TonB-dependent receptor n=1 Tax=Anditalea andensis TaxID=1048983 RepID=A0A074KP39_9BACT|nr:carboxypeptidase regulatory-like domain-containing protein [Anditalea andensis]KEO71696.1 TonB-dependent receptor [Anditalea andensis]
MKNIRLFLLLLFCIVWGNSYGQLIHASIYGTVRDEQGNTLPGATILVRNENTGFTAGTTSAANGSYEIRQMPLGDDYTVSCNFIGFGGQQKMGLSLNQGDNVQLNFVLEESMTELSAVSINSNPMTGRIDRMGASTAVTAKDMNVLPVNGRNFTSLMDLSPVSNGGNLLGQLASSTNYTIDGMTNRSPLSSGTTTRGPFSISMEAIREFEIITNDYDVVNGRSGGGNVSVVTKSGTNEFQGSAFIFNRADWLSSPYDTRGNEREQEFSIQQYGFTLGGPILKDKLHFFLAYDGQMDARPLFIADIRTPEDEARYNISQSSLDNYLRTARELYGVDASAQTGSFPVRRVTHTMFGKVDWQLNAHNLLSIRNNYTRDLNSLGVSDNSSINLYEVYGDHLSTANSFLASWRAIINNKFTNELKVQHLYTLDDGRPNQQLPAENIPRAIVERVASEIGGNTVNTTVQLGGQRYLPERFESNVFQVVNNLYYTTGRLSYTFGVDLMLNNLSSLATSEMNGRFFFLGQQNFENLTPYRYAREVAVVDPTVDQRILASGIYGQAQYRAPRGMDFTLGLRADYTDYMDKPNFNQTVFNDLGLRTDNSARGLQIQPRFQFTWDVNERQRDIIRIGGGMFGSNMNNYAMVNNLQFDGTKIYAVDIQGENVPTPDFPGYRNNPSTAPGAELFDLPGVERLTTINMNNENLKIPIIYKANISYNKLVSDKIRVGVNFIASLGRNNYMYIDRNLVDNPYFRLENEADRGVFVPAASITTSGVTDWTQGRKSENIGRVLELVSEGKNNTYSFILDGTYRYFRDGQITGSYTWNDTRDNTSYNGNVANSATLTQMVVDDPRDLSRMQYSNVHFRHKIVLYGNLPSVWGINVGVRYSGLGGTRYSLRVNGNVNGDFVNSNDLAFVFDPNNSGYGETFDQAMTAVLNNPDNLAKEYIRNSIGRVAERNGGINGFFGSWDIRITKKIPFYGQKSGIELGADLFNVANLIDRNRGLTRNLGNQNLLNISGFDQATQQYNYLVNSNVGVVVPGGNPFQFQLSGRVYF